MHVQTSTEPHRKADQGIQILGLDKKYLLKLPKGSPEKPVLTWWAAGNTTVTLRWLGERFGMGHYTRVTQAIRWMYRRPGRKLEKINRQLATFSTAQQSN